MKLITREGLAKVAADRWKATYYHNGEWKWGSDKETKYYKLMALGANPLPNDVDSAIGNESWTNVRCNECNTDVESAMQVGQEPDYESATATICKPCLLKALEENK